jgi:hypothetical protein
MCRAGGLAGLQITFTVASLGPLAPHLPKNTRHFNFLIPQPDRDTVPWTSRKKRYSFARMPCLFESS